MNLLLKYNLKILLFMLIFYCIITQVVLLLMLDLLYYIKLTFILLLIFLTQISCKINKHFLKYI